MSGSVDGYPYTSPSPDAGGSWHLRNIPCPRPGCERLYSSNSSLRNHIRRKHKGILDIAATTAAPPVMIPIPQGRRGNIYDVGTSPQQSSVFADCTSSRSLPHSFGRHAQDFDDVKHDHHHGPFGQRIHSSRSAGDVPEVWQRHDDSPRESSFSDYFRPPLEPDYYYPAEERTAEPKNLELTRSLSEPGRRWPRQPSYGSLDHETGECSSVDWEATFQRGAAVMEALLMPSHQKRNRSRSTTRPVPEGHCLDSRADSPSPAVERHLAQYTKDLYPENFARATGAAAERSSIWRSDSSKESSVHTTSSGPSYWEEQPHSSCEVSDQNKSHWHAEPMHVIGETLRRTRLQECDTRASPLKYSIQALLQIPELRMPSIR